MAKTFSNQGDKGTPLTSHLSRLRCFDLMLYHWSIMTINILLFLQL